MRPLVSVVLPVVPATSVVLALAVFALGRVEASPVAVSSLAEESPCVADVKKVARPPRILLGETVDVTLTVRAMCAGEPHLMHIAFVLDASGNLSASSNRQMKTAAVEVIRGLEMDEYPHTKVGVAAFDSAGRTLSTLTIDERRAETAVNRVDHEGGARIDLGLQEGDRMLRRGRGGSNDITEAMILMSNGHADVGDAQVLAAARQVKSQGILVIAVCVGNDCDEQLMRRLASSPRYYFRVENIGALRGVFQQVRERIININLKKLVVRDTLSPYMAYVAGSAVPEPSEPPSPFDWLEWTDVYIPKEGVTYTFKVRPTVAGYMPTNAEAWGELTDNKDRTKDWTFPVPWVTVLDPDALPTPDWTATLAPTATSTPEPSPTPTDAYRLRRIFVPYAVRSSGVDGARLA